jgi:hypothetical protein
MTKLFMSLLFFLSVNVSATECVDRVFNGEKITLRLCQNYSNYNETTTLLFAERVRQLDVIIQQLIREGKLKDKKVNIALQDPLIGYSYLMVSQNVSGYYIDGSDYLNSTELSQLIFYFTDPEWRSQVYDPSKGSSDLKLKLMKTAKQWAQKMNFAVEMKDAVLWQKKQVLLKYAGDSLSYFIGEKKYSFKTDANLPIMQDSSVLFFERERVIAVRNDADNLVLSFPEEEPGDYFVMHLKNEVRFGGSEQNPFYSYSFKEKKFIILRKK